MSGNYYLKYILASLSQIVDKAKMIANGSYGIQIQTQYDDEIGDLARMINEMSMQINQNEKAQTEFISSLSHELRTPLTAISGYAEIMKSGLVKSEDMKLFSETIYHEASRLIKLIEDIIKLSDNYYEFDDLTASTMEWMPLTNATPIPASIATRPTKRSTVSTLGLTTGLVTSVVHALKAESLLVEPIKVITISIMITAQIV